MKILARNVLQGDILIGIYDGRGERLARERSRRPVRRVQFHDFDDHRFVMMWTEIYGGPSVHIDTAIEIEEPNERR